MENLKEAIKVVAAEEGKTELEVITMMQAGAAIIEDTKTLDSLCEIKMAIIEKEFT